MDKQKVSKLIQPRYKITPVARGYRLQGVRTPKILRQRETIIIQKSSCNFTSYRAKIPLCKQLWLLFSKNFRLRRAFVAWTTELHRLLLFLQKTVSTTNKKRLYPHENEIKSWLRTYVILIHYKQHGERGGAKRRRVSCNLENYLSTPWDFWAPPDRKS